MALDGTGKACKTIQKLNLYNICNLYANQLYMLHINYTVFINSVQAIFTMKAFSPLLRIIKTHKPPTNTVKQPAGTCITQKKQRNQNDDCSRCWAYMTLVGHHFTYCICSFYPPRLLLPYGEPSFNLKMRHKTLMSAESPNNRRTPSPEGWSEAAKPASQPTTSNRAK